MSGLRRGLLFRFDGSRSTAWLAKREWLDGSLRRAASWRYLNGSILLTRAAPISMRAAYAPSEVPKCGNRSPPFQSIVSAMASRSVGQSNRVAPSTLSPLRAMTMKRPQTTGHWRVVNLVILVAIFEPGRCGGRCGRRWCRFPAQACGGAPGRSHDPRSGSASPASESSSEDPAPSS